MENQNILIYESDILKDGELDENSVVRNYRTTAKDAKPYDTNAETMATQGTPKYKKQQKQTQKEISIKELEEDIKRLK